MRGRAIWPICCRAAGSAHSAAMLRASAPASPGGTAPARPPWSGNPPRSSPGLREGARCRGDDGSATGQGLDGRQAETLEVRRHHDQGGPAVRGDKGRRGEPSGEGEPPAETQLRRPLSRRVGVVVVVDQGQVEFPG